MKLWAMVAVWWAAAPQDLDTIQASLKLNTGGQIAGAVIDSNDHGLVILAENTPYVFAWTELEGGSAWGTRRAMLEKARGGAKHLSAQDRFELGLFALRFGRNDLASHEFDIARKKNPTLSALIERAYSDFRVQNTALSRDDPLTKDHDEPDAEAPPPDDRVTPPWVAADGSSIPVDQTREWVRASYLQFGGKVREVLGNDITLLESEHFLIWTDWEMKERARLVEWCESMYQALCERFQMDPSGDVFLAKCPVFCFRTKARFKAFAKKFDGYDAKNALGYTRSIEHNGHVHMAFARLGRSPADFDRFACTLVHEGAHAFLHRLHGSRLLPHWVNEGFAELTAERVLADRCPAGENARLLGLQYARFDWPIRPLLDSSSTIDIHQYPIAHSVMAFLEARSARALAGFIGDLKKGATPAEALAAHYSGMDLDELERAWKNSFQVSQAATSNNSTGTP